MTITEKIENIASISPSVDFPDFESLVSNQEMLKNIFQNEGAIRLHGFNVESPEQFRKIAACFADDLSSENGEHDPLPAVKGIYTPVNYSSKEKLLWHNENSFNYSWPLVIMFCCIQPAKEGGETPLVDSRKILAEIDKNIVDEFFRKNVMYVRTHGFGFGRSWQETYQVASRQALEMRCKKESIQLEWRGDNQLITKQVRPAIIKHPKTGELSWFNQAQHWHPYCLRPEVRTSLMQIMSEDELPRNCYFGDGSVISDDIMRHILGAYQKLEFSFPWQKGDVMVVDNVLFAHARNSYIGERKLWVTVGGYQ